MPLVCSKPDPVAIRLMAKKAPNLMDWFMVQLLPIYFMLYMVFLNSSLFVYEILGLSALRLERRGGIQLIMT